MRRSTVVGAGLLVVLGLAGCSSTQDAVLGAVSRPLATTRPTHAPRAAAHPVAPQAVVTVPTAVPTIAPPPGKVAVETYADHVCSGLAVFGVAFHDAKAKRTAALAGSPEEVRAALLGFYDAMDSAFETVRQSTQQAGVPKLSGGAGVASGVVATLDAARQAGDRYRAQAQALNAGSLRSVRQTAQRIGADTDRDVAGQLRRLSRYDTDPSVRSAFTHAPSCRLQK